MNTDCQRFSTSGGRTTQNTPTESASLCNSDPQCVAFVWLDTTIITGIILTMQNPPKYQCGD